MDAALHACHCHSVDFADNQISRVANGGGTREVRDFGIGNFLGTGKFVSEGAKAGTENECDARAER